MSFVATVKSHGLNQDAWLTDVLSRLPITLGECTDSLLPTSWCRPIR